MPVFTICYLLTVGIVCIFYPRAVFYMFVAPMMAPGLASFLWIPIAIIGGGAMVSLPVFGFLTVISYIAIVAIGAKWLNN